MAVRAGIRVSAFFARRGLLARVSSASAAAELLLFSCPKRSNQEKGHPALAPDFVRCPVLLASLGPARTRPSLASDTRAFPPSPAALLGAKDGRESQELACAGLLGPVDRGGGPEDQCAASRAGSARVFRRDTDVPSENPVGLPRTRRSRARSPGRLSLAYFSSATQREVGRRPLRPTKQVPQGCVKRAKPRPIHAYVEAPGISRPVRSERAKARSRIPVPAETRSLPPMTSFPLTV